MDSLRIYPSAAELSYLNKIYSSRLITSLDIVTHCKSTIKNGQGFQI
jgi:hypothetical protein